MRAQIMRLFAAPPQCSQEVVGREGKGAHPRIPPNFFSCGTGGEGRSSQNPPKLLSALRGRHEQVQLTTWQLPFLMRPRLRYPLPQHAHRLSQV